jgi:hypothetical protein
MTVSRERTTTIYASLQHYVRNHSGVIRPTSPHSGKPNVTRLYTFCTFCGRTPHCAVGFGCDTTSGVSLINTHNVRWPIWNEEFANGSTADVVSRWPRCTRESVSGLWPMGRLVENDSGVCAGCDIATTCSLDAVPDTLSQLVRVKIGSEQFRNAGLLWIFQCQNGFTYTILLFFTS